MPVGHNCPPPDAQPLPPQRLMRFVGPGPVGAEDFWSYAKNNLPCPPKKVCEWVACSFFHPSIPPENLSDLRKYPNLQSKTSLAYIEFNQNSGPAVIKSNKHVSVWLHDNFYPEKSIVDMISVDDYEPN